MRLWEPPPPYPDTNWHDHAGEKFVMEINNAYDEIIHWRKNLFKVPTGKAGRSFITELTLWLDHYNRGMSFKGITLKVFMTLPCLSLQKPSQNSKAKDSTKRLVERLLRWKEDKIAELLRGENDTVELRLFC